VKVRPALPLKRSCRLARRARVPRAACTLVAGLLGAAGAWGQVMAPGVTPQVLAQALSLAAQVAQRLAPANARVVALPGTLDPRLQLAPCEQVQPFLSAGVPAWGRSRVGLRCVKGPVAWQVHLPVTVQVWAPAPVAQTALPSGTRLDPSVLGLAEVDWAAGGAPPAARLADLQDRVLARPVLAGQPLRPSDLKPRLWFAPGDMVHVVALGSGFAVRTEGQALTPGIEGQPARVRTESGKVLVGQPVGARRMELAL
jgi:flagellar basal body P-ring formation protein FlgA